jgi:hypothetical protein
LADFILSCIEVASEAVYFLPAQIMMGLLMNVTRANDFVQGNVKSILPAATTRFQIWLLRLSQLASFKIERICDQNKSSYFTGMSSESVLRSALRRVADITPPLLNAAMTDRWLAALPDNVSSPVRLSGEMRGTSNLPSRRRIHFHSRRPVECCGG